MDLRKKITIVTGHFGSGKTNFSINLARHAAQGGARVTLIDMDIVNPYFRSADFVGQYPGVNAVSYTHLVPICDRVPYKPPPL